MVNVRSYERVGSFHNNTLNLKFIAQKNLKNKMSRKPTGEDDIKDIDFSSLSDTEREFINSLDEEDSFDLFESDDINSIVGSYFRPNKNPPQWFTIWINRDLYLVDTEGYDYPRYMGRIIVRH